MNSFWQNRKVLVTGAGGFIGSHLAEHLTSQGARVTAMVHYDSRADYSNLRFVSPDLLSKIEIMAGDICDPFFVQNMVRGQDTVFHLAALIGIPYSYRAPQSYLRVNVEGTLNVLEAARSHQIRRVVQTSTSETYGSAIYKPIDEKHPLQAQSPYSASKIAADKLAESYYNSFDLPVCTLRPFNTYGPRQSARAFIPTMMSQLLAPELKEIALGDLTPVRDFNFVSDTVAAFLAIAESATTVGQTLNAGSGSALSIGECVDMIQQVVGLQKPVRTEASRMRPEKSEVMHLVANAEQLTALTGWTAKTTLRQGLVEVFNFIKSNQNLYRLGQYEV